MLVDTKTGKARVSKKELNEFRTSAAQKGHVVDKIETKEELFKAAIAGLPEEHIQGLEEILDEKLEEKK